MIEPASGRGCAAAATTIHTHTHTHTHTHRCSPATFQWRAWSFARARAWRVPQVANVVLHSGEMASGRWA